MGALSRLNCNFRYCISVCYTVKAFYIGKKENIDFDGRKYTVRKLDIASVSDGPNEVGGNRFFDATLYQGYSRAYSDVERVDHTH
jgi:hypothetical protein